MNNKTKKLLISLGAAGSIVSPIAFVVACGNSGTPIKPGKDDNYLSRNNEYNPDPLNSVDIKTMLEVNGTDTFTQYWSLKTPVKDIKINNKTTRISGVNGPDIIINGKKYISTNATLQNVRRKDGKIDGELEFFTPKASFSRNNFTANKPETSITLNGINTKITINHDGGFKINNEPVTKVPSKYITSIVKNDKNVFFGTTNGVFSISIDDIAKGKIDETIKNANKDNNNISKDSTFGETIENPSPFTYFAGKRWLTDNNVIAMAIDEDKGVLKVLTSKGINEIHYVQTTLEKKAQFFEKYRDLNDFTAHGVATWWDTKFKQRAENDNDGLWTTLSLIGDIRRYNNLIKIKSASATNEQKNELELAIKTIKHRFQGVSTLFKRDNNDIIKPDGTRIKNGAIGFPARSVVAVTDLNGERDGYMLNGGMFYPVKINGADYLQKISTSSDELVGHYAAYWELFNAFKESKDNDLKKIAKEAATLILNMNDHLLRNNLYFRNPKNELTSWARFNPAYIDFYPEYVGDKKLNSQLPIMFLQTGLQILKGQNQKTNSITSDLDTNVKAVNPKKTGDVKRSENYAFALTKLLSDYDVAHYETNTDALFQQDVFYEARKNGKNNDNKKINDLSTSKIQINGKGSEIPITEFWKQPSVGGAGYFTAMTRDSDGIKHYISSTTTVTADLYDDRSSAIDKLVTAYDNREPDEIKTKYMITDKAWHNQHTGWHIRPADTKLAHGQSFDTMSNEYNYSDDEEYFAVYPALIESSKEIISLINKVNKNANSDISLQLTINGSDLDDATYLSAIKKIAKSDFEKAKWDALGSWEYVGKLAGAITNMKDDSINYAKKQYLESFPLDPIRYAYDNSKRDDLVFNKYYEWRKGDDFGDPASNEKTPNAAWRHRPLLAMIPYGEADPKHNNNSVFDAIYRGGKGGPSPISLTFLYQYYSLDALNQVKQVN